MMIRPDRSGPRRILTLGGFLLLSGLFLPVGECRAQAVEDFGSPFVISPGDRLRVTVWPDSSLSGVFPVEESGLVHLPLLGAREAAGMTVPELRAVLREGYAQDLQLPVVSLEAEFRVSILGAVRAPGVYWVDPYWGIFDLLSEAGGLLDDAKEDEIVITRASGQAYRIDAGRLGDARSAESMLALRSGDRILVPEGGWWDWRIFLQSLTLVAVIINVATR